MFNDPSNGGFMLRNGEVAEIGNPTKRQVAAIKGGALVQIQEEEYREKKAAWEKLNPKAAEEVKEQTEKKALAQAKADEDKTTGPSMKMTDEELLAYYKENFDVSAEDEAEFLKMNKKEKVKFLKD